MLWAVTLDRLQCNILDKIALSNISVYTPPRINYATIFHDTPDAPHCVGGPLKYYLSPRGLCFICFNNYRWQEKHEESVASVNTRVGRYNLCLTLISAEVFRHWMQCFDLCMQSNGRISSSQNVIQFLAKILLCWSTDRHSCICLLLPGMRPCWPVVTKITDGLEDNPDCNFLDGQRVGLWHVQSLKDLCPLG